jgi:DNA-binding response OmpR family regulator
LKFEKTDNNFVLTVTNTGTGIPDADKDVIFDRFKVLDRIEKKFSQDMKIRSGIGLALCSTWVEKLDGSIVLQSDGISYTSFVVSLPDKEESIVSLPNLNSDMLIPYEYLEDEEENQDTVSKISDNTEISSLPIVLVIDDDDGIRNLLNDILKHKYKVLMASNGKEGLDIINEQEPDIIICDFVMPVMDGMMFLNIIKTSKSKKHIPVVILSSKANIESKLIGLDTDANAYLEKPFHPKYLLALLESLLQNKKNILDYSSSHYAGLEKFRGKEIGKEDKNFILAVNKTILENISREELSPDFIADKLNISKITFYRKIKELLSQTPVDYIRSIRLEQAKKMLLTTDKPVKEIMYDCGFNNKAYFYREFTKHYGVAPKKYRDRR